MTSIGQLERATQNRVIALFSNELGYRYLGDWSKREGNSIVEKNMLHAYLARSGYCKSQIDRAIHELKAQTNNPNRSLYDRNKAVCSHLRYDLHINTMVDENTDTVKLINWDRQEKNDFAGGGRRIK